MNRQALEQKIKELPDVPGVYFFLNDQKEILYIGKATSLRDRVRSYFVSDLLVTRGRLLVDMMALAADVDFIATDSVLEALLLEAHLIKEHLPYYNTKEKDNKSFNHVVITNENFPKILTIRGRDLKVKDTKNQYKYIFGPFPQNTALREALKIIRRIFPYSDHKCIPAEAQLEKGKQPKPCFNRQIGLCPGVCTGEVSKKEYGRTVLHIKLFFEGKKSQLLKELEKEMNEAAKLQKFEKAAQVRRQIYSLTHIQDVAILKPEQRFVEENEYERQSEREDCEFRIEAYDIAHISGTSQVGVMVVVEDSEPNKAEYRKFKIRTQRGSNDIGSLKEVLKRRLKHPEWHMADLIVVDGGQAQLNAAEEILKEHNVSTKLVSVVKDTRHKAREIMGDVTMAEKYKSEILLANSEAHRFAITYHRKVRSRFLK